MSEYPSPLEQADNLAKSAFDVLKGILTSGKPIMASTEEQDRRTEICNNCEYNDKAEGKCTQCGCHLNLKIPFAMISCPINKWDLDEESFKDVFKEHLNKP